MTIRLSSKKVSGLTLVEALVVIGVIFLALGIFSSGIPLARAKSKAIRIQCANNLRQVGTGFRIWTGDNNNQMPMEVSVKAGGTKEFANSVDVFRHFQVMSNELGLSTKILICPADPDRTPASDFTNGLKNTEISYFLGIDANAIDSTNLTPTMFLTGDRNLSDTNKISQGLFFRGTNEFVQWTPDMHSAGNSAGAGNFSLTDGSVQQATSSALRKYWRNTGVATNHLVLP